MEPREVINAIDRAKAIVNQADNVANACAQLLLGRLRKVSWGILTQLKRELRSFNTKTGKWK